MTNTPKETGLNAVSALKSVCNEIYGHMPQGDLSDKSLAADYITDAMTLASKEQITKLGNISVQMGLNHLAIT